MFERWRSKKEEPLAEKEPGDSKLIRVISDLQKSEDVFNLVTQEIFDRTPGKFESVKKVRQHFAGVKDKTQALHLARLIDSTLGTGTFRKLGFISSSIDAPKNVLKILRKDLIKTSFGKQVEKGYYIGVMENYDIQWSLEKVGRDAWQNFFDANGQTLDGIQSSTKVEGKDDKTTAEVTISGSQTYDWRELAHIGATTKNVSTRMAGGFGEGTKDLALILLRDYGAREVQFLSNDWKINFYLHEVPKGTYGKKVRGLYLKKQDRESKTGNELRITFYGKDAEARSQTVMSAKEFFYSSENPDFKEASFDNKKTGGFKVLPPLQERHGSRTRNGHFYQAGQRMHHGDREKWGTVQGVNVWIWEKILPKDRDRGMITIREMEKNVIPFIVDSMEGSDLKKSVYDFKPQWDKTIFYEVGYTMLENIAKRLSETGVKLTFEDEYLANDLGLEEQWITNLLKSQGYKACPRFMGNIGMIKISEKFKELQNHLRIEATPAEAQKIALLKRAAQEIGLEENEVKDVWIFSAENEKNIFHGQYNEYFYWMAVEKLGQSFMDALHVYAHEAAHKKGPHGSAQFEYYWQELFKKINEFSTTKKEGFDKLKQEWDILSKE